MISDYELGVLVFLLLTSGEPMGGSYGSLLSWTKQPPDIPDVGVLHNRLRNPRLLLDAGRRILWIGAFCYADILVDCGVAWPDH